MSGFRCTNHCSQCRRHFHSVAAFDAHHLRDDKGWPQCFAPIDDELVNPRTGESPFVALTDGGECAMYAAVEHGVTIWSLRVDVEKARARWGRPSEPGMFVLGASAGSMRPAGRLATQTRAAAA